MESLTDKICTDSISIILQEVWIHVKATLDDRYGDKGQLNNGDIIHMIEQQATIQDSGRPFLPFSLSILALKKSGCQQRVLGFVNPALI
eukprot:3344007-Ditylum_brightwellii.AAC.1